MTRAEQQEYNLARHLQGFDHARKNQPPIFKDKWYRKGHEAGKKYADPIKEHEKSEWKND